MKNTLKPDWKELTDKDEFKNIVDILCRYYRKNDTSIRTRSHLFREQIVKTDNDNLKIFIRQFDLFQYLLVVELSTSEGKKIDSWIHIDDIAQEKIIHKDNPSHVVHKITGIGELKTKKVKKGFKVAA